MAKEGGKKMAQIIFASHGELSKGMKNSVSMIVGDLSSDVETFSLFPGQNPRDYYQQLLKRVQETDEQFIILTDIKGGSVHTALMPLTQMDNVILLSGMNLVMALDVLLRYKNNIEQSDFDDLAQILQNPHVMYAYEHDFSKEDVQTWLDRQRKRYKEYGFGLWAMILKETNEMIGQAGLTMQLYQNTQILEVGYLLKEEFWHHGYAKKIALGYQKYAFENLQADQLYAIIKADNISSIKVAESLGMKKVDEFMTGYYNGETLHYLYTIERTK